jgi:hypothetical protein
MIDEQEDDIISLPGPSVEQIGQLPGAQSPPPQYLDADSQAWASTSTAAPPASFSTVFEPPIVSSSNYAVNDSLGRAAPAYAPVAAALGLVSDPRSATEVFQDETKRALPQDVKGGEPSQRSKGDEAEPPPAYTEGDSPLASFAFVMAAAGGAASLITQVQQGAPPINTLGGSCMERRPV